MSTTKKIVTLATLILMLSLTVNLLGLDKIPSALAQSIPAVCGDNIINQASEECDGTAGVTSGYSCDSACKLVVIPVAACGDNIINQASEECDGSAGVTSGYTCDSACKLIVAAPAACGDNVINQASEECDGTAGVTSGYTCDSACKLVAIPTPPPVCTNCGGGGGGGGGGSSTSPTLTIVKTSDLSITTPGDTVTYKVTVTNKGSNKAYNVIISDVLPTGFTFASNTSTPSNSWTIGDLNIGESKEITYTAKISDNIQAGRYKNGAVAKADNHGMIYAAKEVTIIIPQILGSEYEELPNTGAENQGILKGWFNHLGQVFGIAKTKIVSLFISDQPAVDEKINVAEIEDTNNEKTSDQPENIKPVVAVDGPNRLIIEKINVEMPIIEGATEQSSLRSGAWHMPKTSDPEKGGNMVLAGHRYLRQPPSKNTFFNLDKLTAGDSLKVVWNGQLINYKVTETKIVNPDQVEILENSDKSQLTLITCAPLYSSKQRLVVIAQPEQAAENLVVKLVD